ncbi:glycosyltransferase family 39 protein [Mycolicibacterium vinylchloridicum]|uniref:glycosyltransferase family 39 protein n=1 Tax=Mycolicibacterium vinylchloridicum TaxID=2736928 RepID=UPI0015C94C8B|nr:glycosyltransferase family 39 protein [Mycolicibacterium vinylchloridicum]
MAVAQKLSSHWFPLFLGVVGVVYVLGCLDLVNVEIDDVFITLRYSHNLLAGDGPVFNPGERIEGYSNPTWLFLVNAVSAVTGLTGHLALFYLAKVLCMVFGLANLVVLYRLAKLHDNSTAVVALLVLVAAASPFLNVYNISGMETSLVAFLLTVSVLLYSLWRTHRTPGYAVGFAVTIGLLSISRPEAIMYPVAIYAGIFAIGARRKDERLPFTAMTVAIVVAIVVAFIAFRFSYYGELLPNSLFAKNNPSLSAVKEGARYVALFGAMTLGPYVLLALLKRSPLLLREHLPVYLVIVAQLAFAVYAGGDWMPAFRLALPVLPILLFVLVDQVDLGTLLDQKLVATLTVLAVVVGCSWVLQRYYVKSYKPLRSGWHLEFQPYNADYYDIARKLGDLASPGQTVLLGEAGVIPYLNDGLRFTDLYGLMDKHIARDVPGKHFARVDNGYLLSRNFDFVVAVILRNKRPAEVDGKYDTGFVALDALLNDPRFKSDYLPVYHEKRGIIFKRTAAAERLAG